MPPPNSEAVRHRKRLLSLVCAALAILTTVTYWSLKDCSFIDLDDFLYVYENSYVQSGLNANSIAHAFSAELVKLTGNWHPVTWLSLMLDSQIFGPTPSGYHLVNLLFHVMSALLLFLVVHRMTKEVWPSAFIAALFAIHPIHVESVAWISERKDVLSAFFWMLTMGAYISYVKQPGRRKYFYILVFFVLGLMAKPMLVTLPFVFLLLDFWPLRRFQERMPDPNIRADGYKYPMAHKQKPNQAKTAAETWDHGKPAHSGFQWSAIYPLLREKAPLFALAIISSIVAVIAQKKGSALSSMEALSLGVRIGNAFISYVTYIWKTIWPANLAVFYPQSGALSRWQLWGSAFLIVGITVVAIWKAKKIPYLTTGWLWYTGTLIPVIGLLQVGSQAMADRYTYIPLIGLFIIAAWGIPDLLKTRKHGKEIYWALSALGIVCLSCIAWRQAGFWRDSLTLFDHTLKVTDHNWLIYNNRGSIHNHLGDYPQAVEDLSRAIGIKPNYAESYYNRGTAYSGLGDYRQAIEDYNRTIDFKHGTAEVYVGRGVAYKGLGDYRRAIDDFSQAIKISPGYAEAYGNRGNTYNSLGDYRQAVMDYSEAIRLQPDSEASYYNRGTLYAMLGQNHLAIEDLDKAIRLNPGDVRAYSNRGLLYIRMGLNQQGLKDFDEAIRLKPDYADAYINRAFVLLTQGDALSGCRDAQIACELGHCETMETAHRKGLCR